VTIDRVGGGALAAIAVAWLWEARKLPMGTLQNPGPAYTPIVLALLLLGFAVLVIALGGRTEPIAGVGWAEWRHAVAILAVLAFMAFALERLGYRLTVMAALVVLLLGLERRHVLLAAVFAVTFALASFHLFAIVLRVPLPRSPWGF
jgi:hypothetical protein